MKMLRRILRKQAGQVLAMALVLLTIGAMVIVPTLILTRTNLNATMTVDQHTRELYAADAGVADALWYLQSEERLQILTQGQPLPYNYDLGDKTPDEQINYKDVQVDISSAWLLGSLPNHLNLPQLEPDELLPGVIGINANNNWTVLGAINIDNTHNFIMDITTNETGTANIDHIGIWLPQGYKYDGNVKINGVPISGPGTNYTLVKNPEKVLVDGVEQYEQPFRGGNVLIWNYLVTSTTFEQLSDVAPLPPLGQTPSEKFPHSIRLSFDYTITPFKEARGFYPWINISTGNRVAWDADAGFYHVESTGISSPTESTTVEAYVPKGVVRYVSGTSGASSAIQGDYIAIGNSLMTCCWDSTKKLPPPPPTGCNSTACTTCCTGNPYRNYPPAPQIFTIAAGYLDGERESSATVDSTGVSPDVPSDAKIERAYLYWTAWLRGDKVWKESTEPGKGPSTWLWDSCRDDSNPNKWETCTLPGVNDAKTWLWANAYDGKAYLAVNGVKVSPVYTGDPLGTVVADTWFISEGSNNINPSYQYSCFADVTDQVTTAKPDCLLSGTTFTVAGVHAHPATPSSGDCTTASPTPDWSRSSNAGWSMVIIYSSAQKKTHQVYLYEGCEHLYNNGIPKEFVITGFAAPAADDLEPGETNEAKMTVFASEGDAGIQFEDLWFKGQTGIYYQLYDVSNTKYVFNSLSSATDFDPSNISTCGTAAEISGIDIDTYTRVSSSGQYLYNIVQPGDTSANIKVQSTGDGFEIIYVVFSVRSTAIPAGDEFNVGSMLYRIQ